MSFIDALNWRYAVKKMSGNKVSEEKLNEIVESIRLAPTSLGMQPFELLVIKNQELKEKMVPISFNQTQVRDASCVLVFSIWNDNYEAKAEEYFQLIQKERNVTSESLVDFRKMVLGFLSTMTNEQKNSWARNQAYIALGVALSSCAVLQVDSTPMEGFNAKELDTLLNLKEENLSSVVMLAIGERDEESDYMFNVKKVRRSIDSLVRFVN